MWDLFSLEEKPKHEDKQVLQHEEIKPIPTFSKPPKKEFIANQEYNFLNLFSQNLKHHSILVPSFYLMNNCFLLFEYLSNVTKQNVITVKSSPDILLCVESNDKTSTSIKVEDARNVLSFAQKTSFSGQKFIVIEKIDETNINAANCLLKIIEEPPANTYFFLSYSNSKDVLQTIASRSILIKEHISTKEHFDLLTTGIMPEFQNHNFETFKNAGYNFDSYKQMLRIKDFTLPQIQKIMQDKPTEEFFYDVIFWMEQKAKDLTQTKPQMFEFRQKLASVSSAAINLNVNKQIALIELTEELYEIIN